MNFKITEKISDIICNTIQVFSGQNKENILNDARKTGEAVCKVLIYNYYGEAKGNDIILGNINYNGTAVKQSKELDFINLIRVACERNPRYEIIKYQGTRSRVKACLEMLRVHGNPASHDPNNQEDKMEIGHVNVIKTTLSNLLRWLFIEYLDEKLPEKLKLYIKSYSETYELAVATLDNRLSKFRINLKEWFKALNYKFGKLDIENSDSIIFVIKIPERRKTIDVLIYAITTEIKVEHIENVSSLLDNYDCDEGWVITDYTVSKAAKDFCEKEENSNTFCYNFDELIEETIDFSKYFKWVENQIHAKNIDKYYVQLACKKIEVHSITKKIMAENIYDENDGWMEGYIDIWMEDHQKEHISILGEFGTGKTWFTLHYTEQLIKKYMDAKTKRLPRPRIPIFIQLRDFSKALSVDILISDFFFRKHNIEIMGAFNAFKQLNKMGKLILIFDGFDEMADKVNKQKMIDNFWEIASIIEPNSKVILTCRNEHFPQIKEGRSLLSAELKESTKFLTGENPQFEVLELLKLNEKQIKQMLINYTNEETINTIFKNDEIVDLLKRPIMTELIIDSLKEIEEGKQIDLSRIYLYAITRKMERDIKQERTFTSLADKLYFLCELSWEMISTDKLSINYKEFPDIIKSLFSHKIKDVELDYWRYDMRGQTILIIDEENGNYKPAHKSFLEFFVAYKFAAQLGVLSKDFIEVAQKQSNIDGSKELQEYTWNEYFNRQLDEYEQIIDISKLKSFKRDELSVLINTFGRRLISKAILDLIKQMIDLNSLLVQDSLLDIINSCRGKDFNEVNYLVSNIVLILLSYDKSFFKSKDLSNLCLREISYTMVARKHNIRNQNENFYNFKGTKFENSDLTKCELGNYGLGKYVNAIAYADFKNANLKDFKFHDSQLDDVALSENNNIIAIGSCDDLIILDISTFKVVNRISASAWHIKFLQNGIIVHSGYGYFDVLNLDKLDLKFRYNLSKQFNEFASDPKNLWTGGFEYSIKLNLLFVGCNNSFIYIYDMNNNKEIQILQCFYGIQELTLNFEGRYLVSSGFNEFIIWDLKNYTKVYFKKGDKNKLIRYNVKFHPKQNIAIITDGKKVSFFNIDSLKSIYEYEFVNCRNIGFSEDGSVLCVASNNEIVIFNFNKRELVKTIGIGKLINNFINKGRRRTIQEIVLSNDGKVLYIITDAHYLISIDLDNECIINKYLHLGDFKDCDFNGVKNLNVNIKEQLSKNRANILG
ncbi:NACHT and WD40 repeat domain-containing protein [Clostridium estertheticum]|uniref:NACHT and WD40 repeat domain-containing protein n=1 Tax=Clostridium estertheticum TaxID=238834 RepID=UPI001C7C9DF2|nr:hypothetical protein [Clostridium estertheticum]MBX4270337.1 hypothetical protein [Clostridium estertheticum]WLC80876.1 hypothetical protein KTC98_06470 [Clostridium estertheticum]